MISTARLLTPLAVVSFLAGCSHIAPPVPGTAGGHERERVEATPPAAPLALSPRKIVGRILAVDASRGFVIVDLAPEPPAAALTDGAALIARTGELRETARLRASRYVRGRTLGATIVSGQPNLGDEVVVCPP